MFIPKLPLPTDKITSTVSVVGSSITSSSVISPSVISVFSVVVSSIGTSSLPPVAHLIYPTVISSSLFNSSPFSYNLSVPIVAKSLVGCTNHLNSIAPSPLKIQFAPHNAEINPNISLYV